jgi:hypothetical protein
MASSTLVLDVPEHVYQTVLVGHRQDSSSLLRLAIKLGE